MDSAAQWTHIGRPHFLQTWRVIMLGWSGQFGGEGLEFWFCFLSMGLCVAFLGPGEHRFEHDDAKKQNSPLTPFDSC